MYHLYCLGNFSYSSHFYCPRHLSYPKGFAWSETFVTLCGVPYEMNNRFYKSLPVKNVCRPCGLRLEEYAAARRVAASQEPFTYIKSLIVQDAIISG